MQLASRFGLKAISIGTIGVHCSHGELSSEHRTTTPSSLELHKIISKNSPDVIFVEVSSHALNQKRLGSIVFDAVGWTNFSQDHLDYHQTMNEYFKAKAKIINYLSTNGSLFVPEDEGALVERLISESICFEKANPIESGDSFALTLDFNKKNVGLAISLIKSIYPGFYVEKGVLEKIETPPGRFDVIKVGGQSLAIVDYAHTPDAVEKIILGVRESFYKKYIIALIGCGGNRDRSKRVVMGKTVCKNADFAIFTSDNPRDEDPLKIIDDMVGKLKFSNFIIKENREEAIRFGINCIENKELPGNDKVKNGAVFLILGKGHESFQEVSGEKLPFSDKKVLGKLLREKRNVNS